MSNPHFAALYEAWLWTAKERKGERAITDAASERHWTFEQMRREEEKLGQILDEVAFPSGHSPEFIFQLLAAWRNGKVTCPLEKNQRVICLDKLPERCAHLKMTSATSGAPKCIAFKAEQLAADAKNIVSTMGLSAEWPNMAVISMAHSYGFSNLVLPLILQGIPLVIAPAPLPEIVLSASRFFRLVTLPAVPALWRTWASSKSIPKNVKVAISAGAPLPRDLEEEVYRLEGLKIHNFYGSSECGGIAYDRSRAPREDSSFVGTAMDNVRLSISLSGTLVVESGAVGERYWPEAQPNLGNGRFETSDLAELSGTSVYLRGRAGDVINVAGRKIAPEMIEEVLRSHPAVAECVVFGVTGSEPRFENIVACVNASVEIAELSRFLSTKLSGWQIPRQWWLTRELKPNLRGKISRHEWRQRFLARLAR